MNIGVGRPWTSNAQYNSRWPCWTKAQ